jgi:hypothetical protein
MRLWPLCGSLVVGLAVAVPLGAQVLQAPPRSSDGQFGTLRTTNHSTRTTHELVLTATGSGGYDDNILPEDPLAQVDAIQPSGAVGTVASGLLFKVGNNRRETSVEGRGYLNAYEGASRLTGADGAWQGSSWLGQRSQIRSAVGLQYQPTLLLSSFVSASNGIDGGVLPGAGLGGVTPQRWLQTDASAGFDQLWTVRQQTSASYTFFNRRPVSTGDRGLENVSHAAALDHSWFVSRSTALDMGYTYSKMTSVGPEDENTPYRFQGATIGVHITNRMTPLRTFEIAGSAGAQQVTARGVAGAPPDDFVTPSAYGAIRWDLGRSWSLASDVRREASLLLGLSDQVFMTSAVNFRAGGHLASRVSLVSSVGFSWGTEHTTGGSFKGTTGLAQLQFEPKPSLTLTTGYTYYSHQLSDRSLTVIGFPPQYTRNVITVGATFWLRLHETRRRRE